MTLSNSLREDPSHERMDLVLREMFNFGKEAANSELDANFPIVSRLLEFGSQRAIATAGAMCLELASREGVSEDLRETLLEEAGGIWAHAVDKWWDEEDVQPPTLRSAIGLACLPSRTSIILDRTLPGSETVDAMHESLCNVGLMAIKAHKTRISEGHRKEAGQVKGVASELAVLLLHQRFTMESLLDGSMLALPSHLSEDNDILDRDGTKISNCWDISVYTEYPPEEPEIAHRIQVKSRFDKRDQKYASGIPVVCIDRDLAANHAERSEGVESITIVRERCLEFAQSAGEMIIERLDARMEKLLECVE